MIDPTIPTALVYRNSSKKKTYQLLRTSLVHACKYISFYCNFDVTMGPFFVDKYENLLPFHFLLWIKLQFHRVCIRKTATYIVHRSIYCYIIFASASKARCNPFFISFWSNFWSQCTEWYLISVKHCKTPCHKVSTHGYSYSRDRVLQIANILHLFTWKWSEI